MIRGLLLLAILAAVPVKLANAGSPPCNPNAREDPATRAQWAELVKGVVASCVSARGASRSRCLRAVLDNADKILSDRITEAGSLQLTERDLGDPTTMPLPDEAAVDNDPRFSAALETMAEGLLGRLESDDDVCPEVGSRAVGGTRITKRANYREVVLQLAGVRGATDDSVSVCSGVLLSGTEVLTAAHCVCPDRPSTIRVTLSLHDRPYQTRHISGARLRIRPEACRLNGLQPGLDVAVLRLSVPVDDRYLAAHRVALLGSQALSEKIAAGNSYVSVVGFGRLDPEGPAGTKNSVRQILISENCIGRVGGVADQEFYHCEPNREFVTGSPTPNQAVGPCNGDSGGPAYLLEFNNNTKRFDAFLLGIVSRPVHPGRCGDGEIYTRLTDEVVAWLRGRGS